MRTIKLSIILLSLFQFGFSQKKELIITHLTGNYYVYTSFGTYRETKYPANGLYLVTKDGVVLIDSPWDSTQFQPLLDSIKTRHNKNVVMCIATHFHDDRTNGLRYFRERGIKTYTTIKTDQLCKERGHHRAQYLLQNDSSFNIGGYQFQTYYPGEGHAPDNIVVWFGKDKVLYGGCLVKSTEDSTLGNLGDANVKTYAETIRNVLRKYKPLYVIPGHNGWQNKLSLEHTLRMAEKL